MKATDSNLDGPARAASTGVIDEAAAHWVERWREGLDAAAGRDLAEWRAIDSRHERAFQRLLEMSAALQRAQHSGATRAVAIELKRRARRRRTRRRALAGVGLAAVLMLALNGWLRLAPSPGVVAEPRATVSTVTESIQRLPDGSVVELHGQAEIAVKFEAGFRRVELVRGEALFSVMKNPNRPFIVRAGGVDVRAVGTAFNVRLEKTSVEILVTEGKVRLDGAARGESLLAAAANGESGLLVAGQRAVVEAASPAPARVSAVARVEIDERLAWRQTQVEFDGIELAQAIEQINRRNRMQLSLEGSAVGKLRISGRFLVDDPETFSRMVAETFKLEAENRGAENIVLRQARGTAADR